MVEKKNTNTKYIDFLDEDEPIYGQMWGCMSFLSPEGIRNCTTRGLKIRGVYSTREQADKRADELAKIDPDFDVFVGEVGKWLPWDPDPNSVTDQVYQEEELNELMKGHKDNLAKAQRMQAQRKKDFISQAAKEEQSKKSKTKARLRKKLEEKKAREEANKLLELDSNNSRELNEPSEPSEPLRAPGKKRHRKDKKTDREEELEETEKYIKEQEKIAQEERSRLAENEKQINNTNNTLSSIDKQLETIQNLYTKMTQKQKSASS